MDLRTDIQSITDLKLRPAEIVAKLNRNHRPIVITQNGHARAVIQDVSSYEQTRKALLLLKLAAQGEAEFKQGKFISHEKLMKHLARKPRG